MFFAPRYGEVIGDLYPYMQVPNRTSLGQIDSLDDIYRMILCALLKIDASEDWI